jgi:DNA invertase Pin-like site-specific DNA recombinase
MNGIIYCRVSTKEQAEGTSLDSQRQACLEYASKKNIRILKVFTEEGESAKFAHRTELLKLIEFCRSQRNQIQALIVWKIDRFARNVVDHFQIKNLLVKYGVTVHSVTEPIDSKPEGKLMETMLAGFAQFDNDIRAVRCVGGMERKVQDGLYPWKPPLGYLSASPHKAKKTQPDIPDPKRFALIKEGWQRLLSGAYTKADIMRHFKARGLTNRRGGQVTAQLVDEVFSNKYYAGILVNPWTKEEFPGKHLPMITPEEFRRAQAIMSRRGRSRPHKRTSEDFPLRAVVICPACRHPLTSSWSRGRSRKYPYYHCYSKHCTRYGKGIPKAALESDFVQLVNRLVPKPVLIPRIEARVANVLAKAQEERKVAAERYRVRIRQMERENDQLIKMRRTELISDAEFIKAHNRLSEEIASLQEVLHAKQSVGRLGKDAVEQVLRFLSEMPRVLEDMAPEFRRRFQQILFPEGLLAGQFGTAKKSPIFKLIDDFRGQESTEVDPSLASWNRAIDQIIKISEALKIFLGESEPADELVPDRAG